VSGVSRKNGWKLAEQAGEARSDGMQRLLNSASWDTDLVRDDLRSSVLERLGDPQAVLGIDETSFPKHGKKSAGVKKQYCGTTGKVENCQVGVFLSYVSKKGHTLIDCELYLPKEWIDDTARRREAGIPDTVHFQTTGELAQQMIERLWKAKIPFAEGASQIACLVEIWTCASGWKRISTPTLWRWHAMSQWAYRQIQDAAR
jgi:SRSO17 transposase